MGRKSMLAREPEEFNFYVSLSLIYPYIEAFRVGTGAKAIYLVLPAQTIGPSPAVSRLLRVDRASSLVLCFRHHASPTWNIFDVFDVFVTNNNPSRYLDC
jgi:hypothetical protein